MNLDRRRFGKSLAGVVGAFAATSSGSTAARARTPAQLARTENRLSPAMITKIRVFYPPNYDRNGAQAFPQSNMVVLVDTETTPDSLHILDPVTLEEVGTLATEADQGDMAIASDGSVWLVRSLAHEVVHITPTAL